MPEYDAGIVLDGWAKIRIVASNRDDVRAKLASASVIIKLVDANHEPICEIIDPEPILEAIPEEIEVHRSDEDTAYHASFDDNDDSIEEVEDADYPSLF